MRSEIDKLITKFKKENKSELKNNFEEVFRKFYKEKNSIKNFKEKLKSELKLKEVEMSHLTTLGFMGALITLIFKESIQELINYIDFKYVQNNEANLVNIIYKDSLEYYTYKDVLGIIVIIMIIILLLFIVKKKKDDYFAKKCLHIIEKIEEEEKEKSKKDNDKREKNDEDLRVIKEEYNKNTKILIDAIHQNKALINSLTKTIDRLNKAK